MKTFASYLTHTLQTRRVYLLAIVISLAGIALCGLTALAQSGAGAIQGTVTDSTTAVIPGAMIHVVNNATGVTADTRSNGVGFYQVPELFAGSYTVTITAPSMKTYRTGVELLVDQHVVVNPVMTPGAVTQQVEVAADVVQLTTTENGTIASTLENARINELPMNGRNLLTLTGMTTPGLEAGGQRANGLPAEAMDYVQDGATLSNRIAGGESGGQSLMPDPDSVQEVRVETTTPSATVSVPGSAIVTTKSGTNSLHGSAFETARNNGIGVAKARQNAANYAAPEYIRNEFGASAGGPIILPHIYHGMDKSFWFFAFERYSLEQKPTYLMSVPTAAMRGGDWSGLINSSGVLQQLYDPSTSAPSTSCNGGAANTYCRTPFANNQIPISRLDPLTKILYDITPLPNNTNDPLVLGNLTYPAPSPTIIPTATFRLDHSFNEKNKAFLRYTQTITTQQSIRNAAWPATIAADGIAAGASGWTETPYAMFTGALGYTHVFSPTFYSETVASNQWFKSYIVGGGDLTINYGSKFGLPNNFGHEGFPAIYASLMNHNGTMFGYGEDDMLTTIDENLTKTLGRHQLQFGGRYRHERFGNWGSLVDTTQFNANATALENPSSGTNYTATSNTGYADADEFLGAATSYVTGFRAPFTHYHDMEFDAYIQDNFHVRRNLTVNIGLRYEAHPAMWAKYGLYDTVDVKNHAIVLDNSVANDIASGFTTQAVITNEENIGAVFETPQQAGLPGKLLYDHLLTFGPRVGLAYQPFSGQHATIVRAAYGRYIFPMPLNDGITHAIANQNPPYAATYTQSYTSASQSPDGLPNYLLRAPQTVFAGVNSANVVNTTTTNSILPGFNAYYYNPEFPPSYVQSVNFTIEQPLRGNSAFRLSYVYTHGNDLQQYHYPNYHPSTFVWEMQKGIVPPTGGASVLGTPQQNTYSTTATGPWDQTFFGSTMLYNEWEGWTNDNALQASYQRLFNHGIAYQIMYVWSRPLRVGGNYYIDSTLYPLPDYLVTSGNLSTMTSPFGTVGATPVPPSNPPGFSSINSTHQMNRYENYFLDPAIPLQHVNFNGIVDLPVGKGKKLLGDANRLLNELVGGFQLAGDGQVISQSFQPTATNWGATSPITRYKHAAKVMDCRSGNCYKAYEWFNGYIAPTAISGNACATSSKTVSGLPSNWTPYQTPVDNTCGTANYGTNNVQVTAATLNAGNPVTVAFSPGPTGANQYSRTVLKGPMNYNIDLSLFKVFPITERTSLRFNMDAFNALNIQGYTNPNVTDGVEQVQPGAGVATSYWSPRQIQLTLRLNF